MVGRLLAQGLVRRLFERGQLGFWDGAAFKGWGLFFGVRVVSWGWVVLWGCFLYLLAGLGLAGCSLPAVGGTPGERGSESQKEMLNWEE